MVLAHGLDLCDVARVARLLEEHGERFAVRCFSAAERAYCDGQGVRRAEAYAARFAAKEAVAKALGTGIADGVEFGQIEVVRSPAGAPSLRLSGRAAELAAGLGLSAWALSLTHVGGMAAASVVATGRDL